MLKIVNSTTFGELTHDMQIDMLTAEVALGMTGGDLRSTVQSLFNFIDNLSYNAGYVFGEKVTKDVMKAEFKMKGKTKLIGKTIVKHGKKTKTAKKTKVWRGAKKTKVSR